MSCKYCTHWMPAAHLSHSAKIGFCRRFPPSRHPAPPASLAEAAAKNMTLNDVAAAYTLWPMTYSSDACGEYKAMEEGE